MVMSQRIGELLLARRLIRAEDLSRAVAFQAEKGERLGGILVRLGALSEDNLYTALAEQTGYGLVTADQIAIADIDAALARLHWSAAQLTELGLIVWLDATGLIAAAAADPLDPFMQEAVEATLGETVRWHFIRAHEFERLHAQLAAPALGELSAERWRELAEDAPVIAFVNSLIAQAIDEDASDIHLEAGERITAVRFRIDGVLHGRGDVPMERYPAISSRIKLIAGLDIAERRLPQDGRVSIRASGAEMDLRVSVIPAVHGESIVMRLLPKARPDLALDRLGFEPVHLARLKSWTQLTNGLVLVTGPTGSGKSTSLYAALAAIDDHQRKIVTVEDPVEQRLPGIVQIQVQAEIGYTFARALRAILRHDPDVILIGEIRDLETAQIAVQSALTGHLVLATLHTNDALSAFTRLIDMGLDPYLVAASVRAIMAQRLVRRLCPACSTPAAPPEGYEPGDWREPLGCPACRNTGYRGRMGIHELVEVDSSLSHAVARHAPAEELERLAHDRGRRSLTTDGMRKAARGETSVAEVLRVAGT